MPFVAQIPTTQPTKKPPQGRFFYWLGWLDSNQRMPVSKTGALPLGDSPILLGICIYILFFQNMQVFFKKIIIFIIFYKMYTEHINLFLCPLFVTNSYIFDITIYLTLFWISIFNLHLMMNTLGESVRDKSLVLILRRPLTWTNSQRDFSSHRTPI